MSLPALEALRHATSNEPLVALARASVADIYRLSGLVDEVVVLPSPRAQGGWLATIAAARALRVRRFRQGIVFPNSFESALTLRLSGALECLGYARDGRGWLLTRSAKPPAPGDLPRHEVFYYLELLRRVGILPALPSHALPVLHLSKEARDRGREVLATTGLPGCPVAISPGAANSRAKQWPPAYFVEAACLAAQEFHAPIVLFGTPQERQLCGEIAGELAARGVDAHSLAGSTSLSDFVCAIAACRLLITNDSGGMHVAYAAGVPTVAIFGPTIHEETGPLGPHSRVVREPVDCSPCMLKDCPIDHRCMTRVSPERVVEQARELVQLQ